MRVSPRRHVLVPVRELLGLSQKEFADAVKLGRSTLQKIELGTYSAPPRILRQIADRTGLDISWLTRNDLTTRPINWQGRRYSRTHFESAQGGHILERIPLRGRKADRLEIATVLLDCYDQARTIFLGNPNASSQIWRFTYRFEQLISDILSDVEPRKKRERILKRLHKRTLREPQQEAVRTTINDAEEILGMLKEADTFTQRLQEEHPYSSI